MAPYPDDPNLEDCKTRTLTITETVYPIRTMGGPFAPGWDGGPGWAIASAPPSDTLNANSVAFTDATSIVGTAFAQTPSAVATSHIAATATIGLASTSFSPATSNIAHLISSSSNAAQVAGPIIGGIASVGIIAVLLLWCCRGKPRSKFKIKSKSIEDKERLREAEEIAAERERALRDLENRRRERETQARSIMGGFDFGSLGQDHGYANGVEPVPKYTTSPRSPRWI